MLRHQLFFDPRVPYTSKNGSASLRIRGDSGAINDLIALLQREMRAWYVPGSDPGLCVAETVPDDVRAFGLRCQGEVVTQEEARDLAARHGLHLEAFGGTEGGVIGALAAVGLLAGGDDGRVVHLPAGSGPMTSPVPSRSRRCSPAALRKSSMSRRVRQSSRASWT